MVVEGKPDPESVKDFGFGGKEIRGYRPCSTSNFSGKT
jgi:5S rRNA maturation endonuclease (ribonuclease M5)